MYRGADKFLARPGRTQAQKHVRDARDFNNIETRAVIKTAGSQGWQPYHLHVPIVLKSGSLNLLEPSGPVQACSGIALPLLFCTLLQNAQWDRLCNNRFLSTINGRNREYGVKSREEAILRESCSTCSHMWTPLECSEHKARRISLARAAGLSRSQEGNDSRRHFHLFDINNGSYNPQPSAV